MSIVTTDVQGVVFARVDEDAYSIQCGYLSGSDVSGCVYVLVSMEEGVENVTGFIERDSNGVTLEVANIGCYSEVLAYDRTTINEILPVRTSINTSVMCPIVTGKHVQLPLKIPILRAFCMLTLTLASPPDPSTTTPPPSGGPNVGAIVGGIMAVLIAVLIVVVVVLSVSCLWYKGT